MEIKRDIISDLPKDLFNLCFEYIPNDQEIYSYDKFIITKNNICSIASRFGSLSLLEWAIDRKCHFDWVVYANAAQYGYLNILIWAHKNEYICESDVYIVHTAAENSHFAIVQWAREKNFKYDEIVLGYINSKRRRHQI